MTMIRTRAMTIGRSFLPDIETQARRGASVRYMPSVWQGCSSPTALRVEHWRHNHPDQDLMVSAAAWVLLKSKADYVFLSAIPPDYPESICKQTENGARFWRLGTVETVVRQGQCASES